ncbi:MAG: hypothetical protein ACTSVF_02380 [Candidatus Asgardarchaeia archaeon]
MVRNLEVIGEACRSLPEEIRWKHSDIEWREIIDGEKSSVSETF